MKQYKEYTFQLERLPEGMMPEDAFDLVADQLAAKGFESFEYDQKGLIGYLPANEDNFPRKGCLRFRFPMYSADTRAGCYRAKLTIMPYGNGKKLSR